jgi:hypothetical protein
MEICLSCGEPAFFRIADLCHLTREITLDACCEANQEGWVEALAGADRRTKVDWMLRETGLKIRDIIVDGSVLSWTLDYGLEFQDVKFGDAADFVDQHHRHSDAPVGWKFGASVSNGNDVVGVVMAGRPISAALQKQGCLEINRVCTNDSLPKGLRWNACSMLYGHASRKAFRHGYKRVVTYTLESEDGTSLRAAGFVPVARSRGGSWNRKNRPRVDKSSLEPKIRWERWSSGVPVHQLNLQFGSV